MGTLGLELVQRGRVMGITGEHNDENAEGPDELQTHFCKLYPSKSRILWRFKTSTTQGSSGTNHVTRENGQGNKPSYQKRTIINLQECSDKNFVSPIVITVKKDGSIKLALESGELNKQVDKNKYQMPNIDELVDSISQIIAERKAGDVYSTILDFTDAYGQESLGQKTSERCNFSFVGGKSLGTFRFKNGF